MLILGNQQLPRTSSPTHPPTHPQLWSVFFLALPWHAGQISHKFPKVFLSYSVVIAAGWEGQHRTTSFITATCGKYRIVRKSGRKHTRQKKPMCTEVINTNYGPFKSPCTLRGSQACLIEDDMLTFAGALKRGNEKQNKTKHNTQGKLLLAFLLIFM